MRNYARYVNSLLCPLRYVPSVYKNRFGRRKRAFSFIPFPRALYERMNVSCVSVLPFGFDVYYDHSVLSALREQKIKKKKYRRLRC